MENPEEMAGIGGGTILGIPEGLPEEEQHFAYLAAEAFRTALDNCMKKE